MIKLNGEELMFAKFPNGETKFPHEDVYRIANTHSNRILFKYEKDQDLFHLLFLKEYLNQYFFGVECYLRIAYMPYSRMDRVNGVSAFTLKYVCSLINSMNFNRVFVFEPHSDVTCALLDRSFAEYPTITLLEDVLWKIDFDKSKDYIFAPDAGAQKRYGQLGDYKQLVGHKDRDFATGRINSLDVIGKVEGKGFNVLIIDDLCSYGGTFSLSAKILKELGADKVFLFVTHCEDSIYKGSLLADGDIDMVYTTNTIQIVSIHEKVKILNIL